MLGFGMLESETLGDAALPPRLLGCPKCGASYTNLTHRCGLDGEPLVAPDHDFLLGRVVDHYRIIERIGIGAMGCVYRAVHTELDTPVALKVLLGELGADERFVARFRREAQILHQTAHPHVVRVLDYGRSKEGLAYMVMELLPGRTLESLLETHGPLPPARVAVIIKAMLEGLASIHAAGFVHRDVKPANVMIGERGDADVNLLDFGIAGRVDPTKGTKLTATGKIVGTPTYMAPEQAEESLVTPAADLYSVGAIMYELLSGQPPFTGNRLGEVLVKHATLTPPPLPPSQGLEEVVMRLLAKAPKDRPQTAPALIALLEEWERALRPTGDVPSPPPPATRRWAWPVAAAVACVLGGFGGHLLTRGTLVSDPGSAPLGAQVAPTPAPDVPGPPTPPAPAPTDRDPSPPPSAEAEPTSNPGAPAAAISPGPQGIEEALARADRALGLALTKKGLLRADLSQLPVLEAEVGAWRSSARGSAARLQATLHLAEAVSGLESLPAATLKAKLDRVLGALARAESTLPRSKLEAHEERLLRLGTEIRRGLTGAESLEAGRSLSQIERDLGPGR